MKKRNLQQWLQVGNSSLYKNCCIQDRYLNLKASDVLRCLRDVSEETKTAVQDAANDMTVGDAIQDGIEWSIYDSIYEDFPTIEDNDEEHGFPADLYALLIAPFEQWIAKTEYQSDFDFKAHKAYLL
ncbi:MAG: hypothetical protein NC347_15100 [Clostridium sp.]|nr:hypothetical protein [Clostridium sp.]